MALTIDPVIMPSRKGTRQPHVSRLDVSRLPCKAMTIARPKT